MIETVYKNHTVHIVTPCKKENPQELENQCGFAAPSVE
jgi:hypothetical protein